MAGGGGWSRRGCFQLRRLRTLVRDTQRALSDVANILETEPETSSTVQEIGAAVNGTPAIVILGRNSSSRVRLLHALLDTRILPEDMPRGVRWIRVQYGASLQVQLSLGNSDFELLEELHCAKMAWDTLPLQDLLRESPSDLTTVLDIEINNQFLKEGLKLIIPPDVEVAPAHHHTMSQIRANNAELFAKRASILSNFNPIYVYAVDCIGKYIFCEDYCENDGNYDGDNRRGKNYVFSAENCLDLQQTKELNRKSQVMFVLFANSPELVSEDDNDTFSEATESYELNTQELPESDQGFVQKDVLRNNMRSSNYNLYEEQTNFMIELCDQWKLLCTAASPKKDLPNNWLILDDIEIMKGRLMNNAGLDRIIDAKCDSRTQRKKLQQKLLRCDNNNKNHKCDKLIKNRQFLINKLLKFSTETVQCYVLDYCGRLTEIHTKLVQQFILASFDLARELQVVPKKIQYVAKQEQILYESINKKFNEGDKRRELVEMMQTILDEMRVDVDNMDWSVDDIPCHRDTRYASRVQSASPTPIGEEMRLEEIGSAEYGYDAYNFEDYEVITSSDESLAQSGNHYPESMESQISSITIENASGDSTIVRFDSNSNTSLDIGSNVCRNTNISIKQASLDVQRTVLTRLSRKISQRLIQFLDCLRDSYFGTLQRCIESLEASCYEELGGRPASEAIRQVLSVARQVDLQSCASFPVLRTLMESLRRMFHKLRLSGSGGVCCVLCGVWRRDVAERTVNTLSPHTLAKIITTQIVERLSSAHERYQSALATLETALASRLHHTEDIKLAIRKKYAPGFARLSLESTSICDQLKYGMPDLGREIGRGQYGVVYSLRGSWGGHECCAVKSVIPADDRHYNELAMEFFYTRSIPAHPCIVRVFGSVIREGAVQLVSERRERDLHAALRSGLSLPLRIRISIDIVHGIRYLHSLGLVHRDIKMKNVLLDRSCRAALADLGFCSSGALCSGSLVGTPVHMAPELLAQDYHTYHQAVDVYAFGVLFWYVCAGNNKLPTAFEAFQNKEQLWSKVRRGLRPERLPHFTPECWQLMQSCWAHAPSQRPLLGDILNTLQHILTLVQDNNG